MKTLICLLVTAFSQYYIVAAEDQIVWEIPFDKSKVNYHNSRVCVTVKGLENCVSKNRAPGDPDEIGRMFKLIKYVSKYSSKERGSSEGKMKAAQLSGVAKEDEPPENAEEKEETEQDGPRLQDLEGTISAPAEDAGIQPMGQALQQDADLPPAEEVSPQQAPMGTAAEEKDTLVEAITEGAAEAPQEAVDKGKEAALRIFNKALRYANLNAVKRNRKDRVRKNPRPPKQEDRISRREEAESRKELEKYFEEEDEAEINRKLHYDLY